MIPEPERRTCKQCGVERPITEFRPVSRRRCRHWQCRQCQAETNRQWYAQNKEAITARRAIRRPQSLANYAAWRAAHRDRVKVNQANFVAKRKGAPGTLDEAEWAAIVKFYDNRCGQCGSASALTVDHFIPFTKGGVNTRDNVWPLCWPCNKSKYNKIPEATAPPHVAAGIFAPSVAESVA